MHKKTDFMQRMANAKQSAEYAEIHLDLGPLKASQKKARKQRPQTGVATAYESEKDRDIDFKAQSQGATREGQGLTSQDQLGSIQIADISDGLVENYTDGDFDDNKEKVKEIVNTINDYQANTIQVGELLDFESLYAHDKDAYLRNVQTKQEQQFNSIKAVHDADQRLAQHFDPQILGSLFKKKALSRKPSQRERFGSELGFPKRKNADLARGGAYKPQSLGTRHLARSVNQTLSHFGEFEYMGMDEQRLLLAGGGAAAPGNQGRFLSAVEICELDQCLAITGMPIYSQAEIAASYYDAYNREFVVQENKSKQITPCMQFLPKDGGCFVIEHRKEEIRAF
jgi:hypothetical protein